MPIQKLLNTHLSIAICRMRMPVQQDIVFEGGVKWSQIRGRTYRPVKLQVGVVGRVRESISISQTDANAG